MKHKIVNQHGTEIPKRYKTAVKDMFHNGLDEAIIFNHKITVMEDHRKDGERNSKVNVEWLEHSNE